MARAIIILIALTGCTAPSNISPIGEMLAAVARGEKACVRNGVLVKDESICRRTRDGR